MSLIGRVVGADAEHRSRFHTRRGVRASWIEMLGIVAMAQKRLRRESPGTPWMVPSAVRSLDGLFTEDMCLLELGSGASTAWYASRVRQVVSLEPNDRWAQDVALRTRSQRNVEIISGPIRGSLDEALQRHCYQVVVIDHTDEPKMSRVDALNRVLSIADRTLKIVIMDDSDRNEYQDAFTILGGWRADSYVGFRHYPLRVSETTVFSRGD